MIGSTFFFFFVTAVCVACFVSFSSMTGDVHVVPELRARDGFPPRLVSRRRCCWRCWRCFWCCRPGRGGCVVAVWDREHFCCCGAGGVCWSFLVSRALMWFFVVVVIRCRSLAFRKFVATSCWLFSSCLRACSLPGAPNGGDRLNEKEKKGPKRPSFQNRCCWSLNTHTDTQNTSSRARTNTSTNTNTDTGTNKHEHQTQTPPQNTNTNTQKYKNTNTQHLKTQNTDTKHACARHHVGFPETLFVQTSYNIKSYIWYQVLLFWINFFTWSDMKSHDVFVLFFLCFVSLFFWHKYQLLGCLFYISFHVIWCDVFVSLVFWCFCFLFSDAAGMPRTRRCSTAERREACCRETFPSPCGPGQGAPRHSPCTRYTLV